MQEVGLEQAIQPARSVETSRAPVALYSDLPVMNGASSSRDPATADDIDILRSQEYDLLAVLLGRAPTQDVLDGVGALKGDASPLGLAHLALAEAAAAADADALQREFFDLFVGVGRGELLPYASYYLSGFLHERPLASVRESMSALAVERADNVFEPEDHVAILCEVMAGMAAGRIDAGPGGERRFFERHLQPWAPRFFVDLETAKSARFYRAVARVGGLFMDIEAEAFAMDA
jgi:TorA maturation chaperone TorD